MCCTQVLGMNLQGQQWLFVGYVTLLIVSCSSTAPHKSVRSRPGDTDPRGSVGLIRGETRHSSDIFVTRSLDVFGLSQRCYRVIITSEPCPDASFFVVGCKT